MDESPDVMAVAKMGCIMCTCSGRHSASACTRFRFLLGWYLLAVDRQPMAVGRYFRNAIISGTLAQLKGPNGHPNSAFVLT